MFFLSKKFMKKLLHNTFLLIFNVSTIMFYKKIFNYNEYLYLLEEFSFFFNYYNKIFSEFFLSLINIIGSFFVNNNVHFTIFVIYFALVAVIVHFIFFIIKKIICGIYTFIFFAYSLIYLFGFSVINFLPIEIFCINFLLLIKDFDPFLPPINYEFLVTFFVGLLLLLYGIIYAMSLLIIVITFEIYFFLINIFPDSSFLNSVAKSFAMIFYYMHKILINIFPVFLSFLSEMINNIIEYSEIFFFIFFLKFDYVFLLIQNFFIKYPDILIVFYMFLFFYINYNLYKFFKN